MVRGKVMCDGEGTPSERHTPLLLNAPHPRPSRFTWLPLATESFSSSVASAQTLRKWATHRDAPGFCSFVVFLAPQRTHLWSYLPPPVGVVVTKVRANERGVAMISFKVVSTSRQLCVKIDYPNLRIRLNH